MVKPEQSNSGILQTAERADEGSKFGKVTIQLTPNDLVNMRFAYSSLLELAISYHRLANPKGEVIHRRWVDEVARNLQGIEFPYLDTLLSANGYVPDFLTPMSLTNNATFEEELEQIQKVPVELIRKNIATLIGYGV